MTSPTRPERLYFTEDDEANALLARDPMALLIGFELDQQVSVTKAFSGPLELQRRIGTLDAARIAALPPSDLEAAFRRPPALHRFPANMARRTQELAAAIVTDYAGDPTRIWAGIDDARELQRRLLGLPGIGEMKARSIVGILARRFGLTPDGWESVVAGQPTLADVDSPASLATYRAGKAERRAATRGAVDGAGAPVVADVADVAEATGVDR